MKLLKYLTGITTVFLVQTVFASHPITVGILEPVSIPAMKQIVSGFEDTLSKLSVLPIHYVVKDAQNNLQFQRAILQTFKSQGVDLIAPIGTTASQMTISIIRNKPIIGIAAENLISQANKAKNVNVTGVNSHVPPQERIAFIHQALPSIKKITLIYSPDDRIFAQVKQFVAEAKNYHLEIQPLMVSQLSDLYTIGHSISSDSQAIFILKDELIVSGLNTLLQQARLKHIPIISSDDGSVEKGAAFALGVSEYQTGAAAGKIASSILSGKPASQIKVHLLKQYDVFVNKNVLSQMHIDLSHLKSVAEQLHYPVQVL